MGVIPDLTLHRDRAQQTRPCARSGLRSGCGALRCARTRSARDSAPHASAGCRSMRHGCAPETASRGAAAGPGPKRRTRTRPFCATLAASLQPRLRRNTGIGRERLPRAPGAAVAPKEQPPRKLSGRRTGRFPSNSGELPHPSRGTPQEQAQPGRHRARVNLSGPAQRGQVPRTQGAWSSFISDAQDLLPCNQSPSSAAASPV